MADEMITSLSLKKLLLKKEAWNKTRIIFKMKIKLHPSGVESLGLFDFHSFLLKARLKGFHSG
jgi:hypothetical protein